jgi:catechol 2,3-dioxygenase-like lactoylglutathione lyase family enzyme
MTNSNVIRRIYDGRVIDHFGINCANWDESKVFYDEVLGALGYSRQLDYQVAIGYGIEGKPDFWIADMSAGEASGPNREVHFAFQAAGTDAVQAFSCVTPTATTSRRFSTARSRKAELGTVGAWLALMRRRCAHCSGTLSPG